MKLLLIDDEQIVLDAIEMRLALDADLEIKTVLGGVAGLQAWQAWQPDITLMDLKMPDLDGMAALRQMKASGSLARHPVIILSGHVTYLERGECRDIGAFDVWDKPLNFDNFIDFLGVLRTHRKLAYPLASQGMTESN